jgi:uncharacterized membrane protein YphA (DoxX/SURF4 family)
LGETIGGLLMAFGLFGPVGSALMVVAASVHVKNGFFFTNNGIEMPMLYAMGASCWRSLGLATTLLTMSGRLHLLRQGSRHLRRNGSGCFPPK